jgi:hypothetical protein
MQFLLNKVAPKETEGANAWSRFDKTEPVTGSHLKEIDDWVRLITSTYTRYPSIDLHLEKYYKFMKYFGEDKPQYYSQINDKLEPLALIHFIEQLR